MNAEEWVRHIPEEGISIKYCARCGSHGRFTEIARCPPGNFYRFSSLKYCPECREAAKREQWRNYQKRRRRELREEHKERARTLDILIRTTEQARENLRLAEQENRLLRQRIHAMGGKI